MAWLAIRFALFALSMIASVASLVVVATMGFLMLDPPLLDRALADDVHFWSVWTLVIGVSIALLSYDRRWRSTLRRLFRQLHD